MCGIVMQPDALQLSKGLARTDTPKMAAVLT